eukprot:116371-Rhodomonas_salina.2
MFSQATFGVSGHVPFFRVHGNELESIEGAWRPGSRVPGYRGTQVPGYACPGWHAGIPLGLS